MRSPREAELRLCRHEDELTGRQSSVRYQRRHLGEGLGGRRPPPQGKRKKEKKKKKEKRERKEKKRKKEL